MQTTVRDAELYRSLRHRKYMSIGKFCYIRFSTLSRCGQQTSLEQNGMCIIDARRLTHVAAAAGEAVAVLLYCPPLLVLVVVMFSPLFLVLSAR